MSYMDWLTKAGPAALGLGRSLGIGVIQHLILAPHQGEENFELKAIISRGCL